MAIVSHGKLIGGFFRDRCAHTNSRSTQAIQAITFSVDLDQERGRKKVRRDAIFRVQVRPAKSIEMYALQAYIEKKRGWDDSVNEAVTFVNHLLRHTPSTTLMAIKRSFFHRVEDDVADLGYGVIAYKGIYQSFRPAEVSSNANILTIYLSFAGRTICHQRGCSKLLLLVWFSV